jgi:hypothetical protein
VLSWLLTRTRTTLWAVAALAGIAVLDLRVIGRLFPEIYALAFWPQFADHLAFGAAGLIRYNRGVITVLDRAGLEQGCCECYTVVKKEFERLLG